MNYDDMSREKLIEIAKKAKDHEIKVNPEYLAAIATSENKQAGIIDTLRKENSELREQLEAIGAGGVNGKLMPGAVSAEPVGYVSKQAIERFQDGRHADIYPSIEELAHEFFDATPMALYVAPVAVQAQQEKIKALESEVSGLRAARIAYANEFPPDAEGNPDVGNIHANIRKLKAQAQPDHLPDATKMVEPSGNAGDLLVSDDPMSAIECCIADYELETSEVNKAILSGLLKARAALAQQGSET